MKVPCRATKTWCLIGFGHERKRESPIAKLKYFSWDKAFLGSTGRTGAAQNE
jgi:hypothetical protein